MNRPRLLYFVPGVATTTDQTLIDEGLPFKHNGHKQTTNGPGGTSGVFIYQQEPGWNAPSVSFDANKQTWSRRFGHQSWVGFVNEEKPSATDLARSKQLPGVELELLDGQRWLIPILRQYQEGDRVQVLPANSVPQVCQQNPEDGEFYLTAVVPQYQHIWDEGCKFAETWLAQISGESVTLNPITLACELLAVNYHVDAAAVSLLQLLSPGLAGDICNAALQLNTFLELLKKKAKQPASTESATSTS